MSGAEAVGALDRPLYVAAKEVKRFLDEGVNPNWEILVMCSAVTQGSRHCGAVHLYWVGVLAQRAGGCAEH
eukprot:m.297730 g.297730  ORF g.297730 m.297730 type:complete len:71 (-) comp16287_c2_seq2:389-601(-)